MSSSTDTLSKEEIVCKAWGTTPENLWIDVSVNPQIGRIEQCMDIYAELISTGLLDFIKQYQIEWSLVDKMWFNANNTDERWSDKQLLQLFLTHQSKSK